MLLSLHGSFAADGIDDADGEILRRVRNEVGPDCPIMAVHDLHSNISRQMVDNADALIIERTYPHVDMAQPRNRSGPPVGANTSWRGTAPPWPFAPCPCCGCRLYTSGLNARSEFKPRNREVCHSSDSNPNGLRPWWQFFGSIIVAAESCQQGHEFR